MPWITFNWAHSIRSEDLQGLDVPAMSCLPGLWWCARRDKPNSFKICRSTTQTQRVLPLWPGRMDNVTTILVIHERCWFQTLAPKQIYWVKTIFKTGSGEDFSTHLKRVLNQMENMDILVHRYAVGQLYWDLAWLLDVSHPKMSLVPLLSKLWC